LSNCSAPREPAKPRSPKLWRLGCAKLVALSTSISARGQAKTLLRQHREAKLIQGQALPTRFAEWRDRFCN
jgi:hypothetical protein